MRETQISLILALMILTSGCFGGGDSDIFYGEGNDPQIQVDEFNLVEENGRLVDYDESSFRVKILASGIVTVRCRGQRWYPTNTLSYYS